MKKLFLLIACIIAGMSETFASGDLKTVTYLFSGIDKIAESGLSPVGSSVILSSSSTEKYGTYIRLLDTKNVTFSLKGYDGYVVKSLTLKMCSNQKTGSGTFSFISGDREIASIKTGTSFKDWYNMSSFAEKVTDVNVVFNSDYTNGFTVGDDEEPKVKISATENSLYVYGFSVTYERPADLFDKPRVSGSFGDTFYRKQRITMSCEHEAEAIYFTMDGSEPTTASEIYSEDKEIYIDKTTTIKAFAVNGADKSGVVTKTITKSDNIKAIVTEYNGNRYAMGKDVSNENSSYLSSVKTNNFDGNVICGINSFNSIAWIFNEDGTIQNYGNHKYLSYADTDKPDIVCGDKGSHSTWKVTTSGIGCSENNRFLSYSVRYKYFGAFSDDSPKADKLNIIKGFPREDVQKGSIGTICMLYDVLPDDIYGADYYNILGKKMEDGKVVSLVLEKEAGKLKAGRPYIFIVKEAPIYNLYLDTAGDIDNPVETAENYNGLHGNITGTLSVDRGMFLISGNKILKCGTGCTIAKYRAYINMDEVSEISSPQQSLSKRTVEMNIGDGTTGIEPIAADDSNVYYNMQGQQVSSPKKGLYIVNGKKRIIR